MQQRQRAVGWHSVAAVHPHGAGLQVHFDQLLANGKIEVINATDEDEWMWGDHTLKPPDYTRFPEVLRDQHSVHHQLEESHEDGDRVPRAPGSEARRKCRPRRQGALLAGRRRT